MTSLPEVTVIVPTKALAARAAVIQRALDSIRSQRGVRTVAVVVVNGSEKDPSLVGTLQSESGVKLIETSDAGIPNALRIGREAVTTEWFTSLDDDDLILPDGLAVRVEALKARPDCNTIITNSLRRHGDHQEIDVPDMAKVERSPLDSLSDRNWLRPGAWLCRSAQVSCAFFDQMPPALECTYLAIRFVLNGGVCFLDRPTIAHYTDTPDSETKLDNYPIIAADALLQIRGLPLPADTRRWIDWRISSAHHSVANLKLMEGDLNEAWRRHLLSLRGRAGWRYLSFTRRLLAANLAWRTR